MIKRPPNDAPDWRWRLYNNWHGYSNPGRIVRALWKDALLGLLEGPRMMFRWMLPILFAIEAVKVIL